MISAASAAWRATSAVGYSGRIMIPVRRRIERVQDARWVKSTNGSR